jgi:Right handed beta helix region
VAAISGDVIIENSELAFNGDDVLNIHGISRPVVSVSGRRVTVSKAAFPNVGDVFAFFATDGKTKSDFGYLGSARITEVAPAGSNSVLTLDAGINGLSGSAITVNQTRQMSVRYYIQNNSFHDNRGNGVVMRSVHSLVDNNHLSNNTRGGIAMYTGGPEGRGVENATVTNNTVVNPGQVSAGWGRLTIDEAASDYSRPVTAHVNSHIVVSNNTVENTLGVGYLIASAHDVKLFGNRMISSNLKPREFTHTFGSTSSSDSLIVYGADQVQICSHSISGSTSGRIASDSETTSGISIDGALCNESPVIGYIDGVTSDSSGTAYVDGWACAREKRQPVLVNIFGGDSLIASAMANLKSSAAIAAACNAVGSNFYFRVPLSRSEQKQFSGRVISVYGVSPYGPIRAKLGQSSANVYKVPSQPDGP